MSDRYRKGPAVRALSDFVDRLKTFDASNSGTVSRTESGSLTGVLTPSRVAGIGNKGKAASRSSYYPLLTLYIVPKPDYSEDKIVVAMVRSKKRDMPLFNLLTSRKFRWGYPLGENPTSVTSLLVT